MLVYPQLPTGALSQYPLVKRQQQRTVSNAAADGSSIKVADPAGARIDWQLHYKGLSDLELSALQQFFVSAEGSLNGFTFLDPAGNLLAWSEDLSNAVWDAGPFLAITGQVTDPFGGTGAFHLTNSGAGSQSVIQTLNAPAGYLYTISVYARAAQATTIGLLLGSHRAEATLGSEWSRVSFSGSDDPTAAAIAIGVDLLPGAAIDIFGPQAEPQAAPSNYQKSARGGVYDNARFRDDVFSFTTTDLNRHSATVNITYADHL
jgi:hypothetical protein